VSERTEITPEPGKVLSGFSISYEKKGKSAEEKGKGCKGGGVEEDQ